MIEIIGDDKSCGRVTKFQCKCEACGCIFTAGLDDCDLVTSKSFNNYAVYELKLRIKCPRCSNALLYSVKED